MLLLKRYVSLKTWQKRSITWQLVLSWSDQVFSLISLLCMQLYYFVSLLFFFILSFKCICHKEMLLAVVDRRWLAKSKVSCWMGGRQWYKYHENLRNSNVSLNNYSRYRFWGLHVPKKSSPSPHLIIVEV